MVVVPIVVVVSVVVVVSAGIVVVVAIVVVAAIVVRATVVAGVVRFVVVFIGLLSELILVSIANGTTTPTVIIMMPKIGLIAFDFMFPIICDIKVDSLNLNSIAWFLFATLNQ